MTPVESIRKLLTRSGWRLEDVDLFEINEAFAAQMVADHQGARARSGARQRQRRRDCAGPPHRRQRRACAHDAALCHEGARREARHRLAVPGRRQWRGAGGRDVSRQSTVDSRKSTRNRELHGQLTVTIVCRLSTVDSVRLLQNAQRETPAGAAPTPSDCAQIAEDEFVVAASTVSTLRRKYSSRTCRTRDENGHSTIRPGGVRCVFAQPVEHAVRAVCGGDQHAARLDAPAVRRAQHEPRDHADDRNRRDAVRVRAVGRRPGYRGRARLPAAADAHSDRHRQSAGGGRLQLTRNAAARPPRACPTGVGIRGPFAFLQLASRKKLQIRGHGSTADGAKVCVLVSY